MEYFEAIGDPRFIYFQRKMNNLMMNPYAVESMQKKENTSDDINKSID